MIQTFDLMRFLTPRGSPGPMGEEEGGGGIILCNHEGNLIKMIKWKETECDNRAKYAEMGSCSQD